MHFDAKKFFLIGFILLLLVGIPASVYLVQQQQELRSRAAPNTRLSFQPESSPSTPITRSIGEDIPLEVMVDPDTNVVNFVRIEILYDPDKLATASANAFQPNTAIFSTVIGPTYSPNKIVFILSAENNPTKYISTKTRVATITLRGIANTDAGPTMVRFGPNPNTIITSASTSDEAAENVLGGSDPATIVIAPQGTPAVTDTPPQPEPTDQPEPTSGPVPTSSVPENPSDNIAPVCTALTADTTSGIAPLAVNFTANGTDDDDTISKATFNFGDGQVSDVTSGGALGTNSVNVQLAHTYTVAGVYQATAILTDSNSGVSDTANCSQMITVTGGDGTSDNSSEPIPTATPAIESPGAEDVLFGFGAIAAFLMVTGALIFFLL